eukprot:jgi/Botrbrau1/2340/Bobra.39_1s0029.1
MGTPVVTISPDAHFSLHNIPFGVFSPLKCARRHIGTAIGHYAVSITALASAGLVSSLVIRDESVFSKDSLNDFMSLGRPAWKEVRTKLQDLLSGRDPRLKEDPDLMSRALFPLEEVEMHLPAQIGDYTDFYLSKEHATNCGIMLRGADNALHANWLHLPVAYHGRASSIVVSGTDVRRPRGQVLRDGKPVLAVSKCLDFELEMGVFIGTGNALGHPIDIEEAREHIFGFVLLNDWSARDLQTWEMVPLGPFISKNTATSISPWIVTLEALEPFRVPAPIQDPPVLAYLQEQSRDTFDIHLEASIQPEGSPLPTLVTCTNLRYLYWTAEQMVAHHSVGGCNLRAGDLLGTGTISSPGEKGAACLLELTWKGTKEVMLEGGEKRTYLCDGDAVSFTGYCQGEGYRVGFGTCDGKILPALP